MLRLRKNEYLARPGFPTQYTSRMAAKLIGIDEQTVRMLIRTDKLKSRKANGIHQIARSEVLRLARERYADRPVALARVLFQGHAKVVAVSEDRKVRESLAKFRPQYAASSFALGQLLCVVPSWVVVIDMDFVGSETARGIAERVGSFPDRPLLVGILAEHSSKQPSRFWDALIPRPGHVQGLKAWFQSIEKLKRLSKA